MQIPFPDKPVLNRWGNPDQESLLFLHANSFSAKLYQSFLEPLEEQFDIWAPDLPGHGESRWNGRVESWLSLAEYFIMVLDKSPPKKPLVGMGHSIGGIVMMLMAIQRPHWFRKLILLDPVMLPKRILMVIRMLRLFSLTHIIPMAKAAVHRKNHFASREVALAHYSKKQVFSSWKTGYLETYVATCLHEDRQGALELSCAPTLESSIYQSIPVNVWSLPKRLEVPTLFIIGEKSDTVNRKGQHRLARIKGNHVVKTIDAGHLFPFEKPEESMEYIKDYLAT